MKWPIELKQVTSSFSPWYVCCLLDYRWLLWLCLLKLDVHKTFGLCIFNLWGRAKPKYHMSSSTLHFSVPWCDSLIRSTISLLRLWETVSLSDLENRLSSFSQLWKLWLALCKRKLKLGTLDFTKMWQLGCLCKVFCTPIFYLWWRI